MTLLKSVIIFLAGYGAGHIYSSIKKIEIDEDEFKNLFEKLKRRILCRG